MKQKLVKGLNVQPFLVKKNSALMQGFILGNHAEKIPEATSQLLEWFKDRKF
jgi:NADPH-dependent curcumin reductase CurA